MPSPPPDYTDYTDFTVGAVQEPLSTTSSNTLLQDADPPVFHALSFWKWLIVNVAGPRLLLELTAAGVKDNKQQAIASVVAQAYPFLPTPQQLENQIQFPLLAIGRTRTLTGRFTAAWEHDRGLFTLVYALPPLDAAQSNRVLPLLHAIEQLIRQRTTQSFDPGYTPPGGTLGESPWKLCAVERIGFGDPYQDAVQSTEYGSLEGTGGQYFPCIRMTGYMVERDMYTPSAFKFEGADITADLVADDETTVPDFLSVSTQSAPTLTGISPATGAHAGGTSVTLTGTLFLQGGPQTMRVFFGNTPATSAVWVSATSVTCVSPAVSGAGTVDVTLVNRDGQLATLPSAFAYT